MSWLHSGDNALFRFINLSLGNPFFDKLMPLASDTPGFVPLVLLVLVMLIWRGGARGRICAAMLVLGFVRGRLGDCRCCQTRRRAPPPFPSFSRCHRARRKKRQLQHAFVARAELVFGERSIGVHFLPAQPLLHAAVGLARKFLPDLQRRPLSFDSGLLDGAIIGAGSGAAIVWSADALWRWAGRRWFPLWHARLPSLLQPEMEIPPPANRDAQSAMESQWLNLGCVLIALLHHSSAWLSSPPEKVGTQRRRSLPMDLVQTSRALLLQQTAPHRLRTNSPAPISGATTNSEFASSHQ